MSDLIPVARLDNNDCEGSPLITAIDTREGWACVWDVMDVQGWHTYGPHVEMKDAALGWKLTIDVMPRAEYEALPEHGGW